jgi:signal transduction histidine kinase
MIALWNRSLAARFVGVMLLALALSQGVSVLLFSTERDEALMRSAKAEFLSRCASVAKVLESTPSAVHRDILSASDTPYSRSWISQELITDTAAWRHMAKARLAQPLPTIQKVASSSTSDGSEEAVSAAFLNGAPHETPSAQPWFDLPPHAWPLARSAKFLYLDQPNTMGMGVTVQLPDGTWFNTVFSKKLANGLWTSRSMLSLALTAVFISLCAAWIAQAMTRPMRDLAVAAEALGRGENVPALAENGPDDIRNTAEAFNRMQARLQRFVDDRTRMLAAIGHDLRTPLTSLRLRAEFVSDEETREKMLATLDELRQMTEATLAFSRDQAVTEPTRNVNLTALVESLCDDLAEIKLDVSFEGGANISYRCRADALKRALRNLIENAVRYGERARVHIENSPAGISIVVEDSGPGIREQDIGRVFAPFFRLENSRNRETGGIGLGLSIAQDIVRHHGGDISLSNTGSGLRATIALPHAAASLADRRPTSHEAEVRVSSTPSPSPAE